MGYKVGPVGTGTVSTSAGTPNVTGSSTVFETQFEVGDTIVINGEDRVILSITNDTALVTTTNFTGTNSGVSFYCLRNADEYVSMIGEKVLPRSNYSPGTTRQRAGSGKMVDRGYARATWTWAIMTVTEWIAFKSHVLAGEYSGPCCVETRDDEDTYTVYSAIMTVPIPEERRGARWIEVPIEFMLVEAIA